MWHNMDRNLTTINTQTTKRNITTHNSVLEVRIVKRIHLRREFVLLFANNTQECQDKVKLILTMQNARH